MVVKDYPRYGDVYDVNLEPVTCSEIGKSRPTLVVSNDTNNEFSSTVTVIPISSLLPKKVYPFEVVIPAGTGGLTVDSRVKADQVRTVDKQRLIRLRGKLPAAYFPEVEKALKIHLNMK